MASITAHYANLAATYNKAFGIDVDNNDTAESYSDDEFDSIEQIDNQYTDISLINDTIIQNNHNNNDSSSKSLNDLVKSTLAIQSPIDKSSAVANNIEDDYDKQLQSNDTINQQSNIQLTNHIQHTLDTNLFTTNNAVESFAPDIFPGDAPHIDQNPTTQTVNTYTELPASIDTHRTSNIDDVNAATTHAEADTAVLIHHTLNQMSDAKQLPAVTVHTILSTSSHNHTNNDNHGTVPPLPRAHSGTIAAEQILNDVSIHCEDTDESVSQPTSPLIHIAPVTQPSAAESAVHVPHQPIEPQASVINTNSNDTMSSFYVQNNITQLPNTIVPTQLDTVTVPIDKTLQQTKQPKAKHTSFTTSVPTSYQPSATILLIPSTQSTKSILQNQNNSVLPNVPSAHPTIQLMNVDVPYTQTMTLQQKLQHITLLHQTNRLTELDDSLHQSTDSDVITDTSHSVSVTDEYELVTGDISELNNQSLYQSKHDSPPRIRHTRIVTEQHSTTTSPRRRASHTRLQPRVQQQTTQSQNYQPQPQYINPTQHQRNHSQHSQSIWSDTNPAQQPYYPQSYEYIQPSQPQPVNSIWTIDHNAPVRQRSRQSTQYMRQQNNQYTTSQDTALLSTRSVNVHNQSQLLQPTQILPKQNIFQPLVVDNVSIPLDKPVIDIDMNQQVSRLMCVTDDLKYISDSNKKHELWIAAIKKQRQANMSNPAYHKLRVQPLSIDSIAQHWHNQHQASTAINNIINDNEPVPAAQSTVADSIETVMSPIKTIMTETQRNQLLHEAEHIADLLLGIDHSDNDDTQLLQHAIQLNQQLKNNTYVQPNTTAPYVNPQSTLTNSTEPSVITAPSTTATITQNEATQQSTVLTNLQSNRPLPARNVRTLPEFKPVDTVRQELLPVEPVVESVDNEIEQYKSMINNVMNNKLNTTRANTLLFLQQVKQVNTSSNNESAYNNTVTQTNTSMQKQLANITYTAATPYQPYSDPKLNDEVNKLDKQLHALHVTAQLVKQQFGTAPDSDTNSNKHSVHNSVDSHSTTGLSDIDDHELYVPLILTNQSTTSATYKSATRTIDQPPKQIGKSSFGKRITSSLPQSLHKSVVHSPVNMKYDNTVNVAPAQQQQQSPVLKTILKPSSLPKPLVNACKLSSLKSKVRPSTGTARPMPGSQPSRTTPSGKTPQSTGFKINLGIANVKQSIEQMSKQGAVSDRYKNVNNDLEFEL